MTALVSVIIPTRNRARYVTDAIASVLKVAEPLKPAIKIETLVIDDGSTDETEAVVQQWPVRYIRGYGRGAAAARNLGVQSAHGEYLAFLDDDDIWLDGHLRDHCRLLQENPGIGLVFAQGMLADHDLNPVWLPGPDPLPPAGDCFRYFLQHCIPLNTVVVRRAVLETVGAFDESLNWAEDWDWELRVANVYSCAAVPSPVSLYRQWSRGLGGADYWSRRCKQTLGVVSRGARLRERGPRHWLNHQLLSAPIRGWHAFHLVCEAQLALSLGNRLEAWRCLFQAARIAPLHACLRVPGYWPTVVATVRMRGRSPAPCS